MDLFLTFLNHFIPLLLTILMVLSGIALWIGMPYCRYVNYVSKADTYEGRVDLAKYLAHKTGGRKIDVDYTWPKFMSAATTLHQDHVRKRKELFE